MHPQAPLPEEQPPVAEADAAEGDADGEESVPASAPSGPAGAPTSREDAYRQLLLIADYLARTEPHSPVPYLIKRAVEWGNKPLSELLAEPDQCGLGGAPSLVAAWRTALMSGVIFFIRIYKYEFRIF